MKAKKNNKFWAAIALLSFLGMAVGFLAFNADVIAISSVAFFIACVVLGLRFMDKVDKAFNSGSPLSDGEIYGCL